MKMFLKKFYESVFETIFIKNLQNNVIRIILYSNDFI